MGSKVIKKLSLGYSITAIGNSLFNASLVLLMAQIKGFNESQISLIISITSILVIPVMLVWGIFIDKSKKLIKFAKISILGTIALTLLMLITNDFYLFFIVYLIKVIFLQPYGSIMNEYAGQKAAKANKSVGSILGFGSAGWGLAGIIGLLFMDIIGVIGLMVLSCIMLSIQYINLLNMEEYEVDGTDKEEKVKMITNLKIILKNKEFMWFFVIFVGLMATSMATVGYGNSTLLIRLEAPARIISLVPFFMVIPEVFIIRKVESFAFFKKIYFTLLIGALFLLIRWIIVGVASNYWVIMGTVFFHGFHQGILWPLSTRATINLVGERQRSTAFLLTMIAQTLVTAIINFMSGRFLPIFGNATFGLLYSGTVILCIIPLLYKFIEERKKTN